MSDAVQRPEAAACAGRDSCADAERLVAVLLAGRGAADCTYDELADAARQWFRTLEASASARPPRTARDRCRGVVDVLARRRLGALRGALAARRPMERAVTELFLSARMRTYVLAYLSVQEGSDFEGSDARETRVPQLLVQTLRTVGRLSHCTLRTRILGVPIAIDLDPLRHARAIYAGILGIRGAASTRLRRGWHRMLFRAKCRAIELLVRRGARGLSGASLDAAVAAAFRSAECRKALAIGITALFPGATSLGADEWRALLDRVEATLGPRVASLVRVLPPASLLQHGFIKLLKVALGTVAGRLAARGPGVGIGADRGEEATFIVDSLRMGFCWGLTYPLVDNVLDSPETTSEEREQLLHVLTATFTGRDGTSMRAQLTPAVAEVAARLDELLSLVPPARLPRVRRLLAHLLESHERDARRRLSIGLGPDPVRAREDLYVDLMLKSALVRLATMELTGLAADAQTTAGGLVRALFNQMGDDLWDVYEDFDAGQLTPFTVACDSAVGDPYQLYLDNGLLMAEGVSRRRRVAALLGVLETLRLSVRALDERGSDPLGVADAIRRLLHNSFGSPDADVLASAPHVDLDAVVFGLESACLGAATARQR